MSVSGLKQLTIAHLRGSVTPFSLPFEAGKKLTVVYGENAAGKSTICDALEFLGKGKVGSIENRGLGKTTKYWPSVGRKAADISVSLETLDGITCRASLLKNEVNAYPPVARPLVEVLRRGQILALVEAKPADRYAAISRFVDVSGVEASEAALRQLIRDLHARCEGAVSSAAASMETLVHFWEAAGKPASDPISWAASEIQRDPAAGDADIVALRRVQTAYSRLTGYPNRLRAAREGLRQTKERVAQEEKRAQQCVEAIAADAGELMGVLLAARAYLEKHPGPGICPLCEGTERMAGLGQRVTERLASLSTLQTAQSRTREAELAVQRAEQQLELVRQGAKDDAAEFEKARASYAWPADIPMPPPAPSDVENLERWLETAVASTAQWSSAEARRQDAKQFVSTLRQTRQTYLEHVRTQGELSALLPDLERALKIVEEERRAFTDSVLGRIAGEVGRIFELLHPGEGLNKISLELDPQKRASLEIAASFCDEQGAPPQAYFSESHLDTLGLCVFLALAALDAPEQKILVLDDVLAGVDEPHSSRLIEMLAAEAARFRHCLLTTHYRPWKEKLRGGRLKNGQCQFVELARWTSEEGMKLAVQ